MRAQFGYNDTSVHGSILPRAIDGFQPVRGLAATTISNVAARPAAVVAFLAAKRGTRPGRQLRPPRRHPLPALHRRPTGLPQAHVAATWAASIAKPPMPATEA